MRIADLETGARGAMAPSQGSSLAELRHGFTRVAGVASVDLDLRPVGPPVLRAQLDGSRPAEEVARELQLVLAQAGLAAPESLPRGPEVGAAPVLWEPPAPPSGTDPGTATSLISTGDGRESAPTMASVTPLRVPVGHFRLELLTVEETPAGLAIRAADSDGRMVVAPVADPATLNAVIVAVVARLADESPAPSLLGAELKELGGITVLTVVLGLGEGRRAVGAAALEGGMPFTLGSAIWEALAVCR